MAAAGQEDLVAQFCAITGSDSSLAESLLQACNNSLEMAINMHMEGVDATQNNGKQNKQQQQQVEDEDEVRAPIPQKQETLVEAGYEGYQIRTNGRQGQQQSRVRTVFDGFRNFGNEARNYSDDNNDHPSTSRAKKRTLEELFKPPLDLMFKGDWQMVRDAAEGAKKWLLVNIQDAREFQCQLLNRDIWSNQAVKTIIKEHFIFWQQYQETEEAQRFMTFYPITEWPHVSILDPRTGEQLVTWNKISDPAVFTSLVTDFLTIHPTFEPVGEMEEPKSKRQKTDMKSILDADEEDQLAAAIQASLAESKPSSSVSIARDCNDNDNSDSDIDLISGDDSNMSTPVKRQSKANSPERSKKSPERSKKSPEKENGNSTNGNSSDEEWKKYLGSEDETEKSRLMIRFPDGKRENKCLPASSQLKAVVMYIVSRGFSLDRYEIVTNFPRRTLTDLDHSLSLKHHDLFPQEAIFVQQK